MAGFPSRCLVNRRCGVFIRSLLEKWGGAKKHRRKLSAPVVLCDFTLANKHAGAPNGHFAWLGRNRDHTYLESGVCWGQHCQLPSITPQTYENLRIKSETVMAASSWAPLARVYVQIILMPCLLLPNWKAARQSQSLCWDTCTWTKKPPNLFALFGALGVLQWKSCISH